MLSSVTTQAVARVPHRGLSPLRRREAILGYLFISPWVLGFLFFTLGPFLASMYLSLTDYTILRAGEWVGLKNYIRAFTREPLFWTSLYNTAWYVVFVVPTRIVLGFLLALLLNTKVRGLAAWRTFFYMPTVTPIVATTILWLFLLNPNFGMINYALSLLGIEPLPWLTSPTWSKPALFLMSLWWVGGNMVIFLAGLQGIPQHLYEAAELDGANAWHRLIHVTIPMMTPTIFFNLIMNIIGTFQVFTQAFIMTGGGPLNSTRFYMLYLYDHAFRFFEMGYASALAWVLFVIIMIFTLLTLRSSERWVFYGH
ncbi:MAG: sugar ABC transporter permease [Chloroflexi bacterium]|nr:sugar ABC transporter permease [Chloroflexota bacterium]